jgi:hypothetical protein
MARPTSDVTKLILSLPADLPTNAVIQRANENGFTSTQSNVSRVRKLARRAAADKAAETKKPATSKPASNLAGPAKTPAASPLAVGPLSAAGAMSRAEFIRRQSFELPAMAVVRNANAAGLDLKVGLVYRVRRATRERAAKVAKAVNAALFAPVVAGVKPAAPKAAVAPSATAGRTTAEELLRAAASEIGLERAIELLEDQRMQLVSVLDG